MTNGRTIAELKNMLEEVQDENIPEEVNRRLLALMIMTNTDSINKLTENLSKNHEELTELFKSLDAKINEHIEWGEQSAQDFEEEVSKLKKEMEENPTFFKALKTHPKKFAIGILGVFLLLNMWFVSGLRYIVLELSLHLIGIPDSMIEEIMQVFFK